ncbi:MAG: cytochrome c3 family protein, partial [Candidatus Zixiibacteriota bacterium]
SAYGAWCQGCHTNFHGTSTDANMRDAGYPDAGHGWYRHPTADINIGQQSSHGHTSLTQFRNNLYRTQVMTNGDDWGVQGVAWAAAPTDLTPSCFSCHKSHGNKNAFGLIYAKGTATLGEEGDGSDARNLCRECHVQGADP